MGKGLSQDLRKSHLERRTLELLDEIVVQQTVFELINGAARFDRPFFEVAPHQEGAADVVALDPGFATLAAFQPRDLLTFAVHQLDLRVLTAHWLNVA